MPEKPEPKISTGEVVVVGVFLLILDAIDLIPIAGDLTDIAAAPLLLYYHTKHINGVAYGISCVLDLIPFVQEFPTRTLVWVGTVAFDRLAPKKVEEVVEGVGEKLEGGEGGGEIEGGLEAGGVVGTDSVENAQRGLPVENVEEQDGVETRRGRSREEMAAEEESLEENNIEAEGGRPERGGTGEGSENPEERGGGEGEGEEEDIMAPESEKNPEKVEEKKLFEELGDDVPGSGTNDDEEEEAPSGNVTSIENSPEWQKNQQARRTNKNTADVIPPKKDRGVEEEAA